jgi:hypothetical protein
MGFKELKEKAKNIKDNFLEKTAKTLSDSNFTISSKEELEGIIKRSSNTSFKDKET